MKFGALLAAAAVVALGAGGAAAQSGPVKIGVLNDMSSLYADISGPGSVVAARMAVEDLGGKALGQPVEIISGDHQNKPDVGAAIARQWYDQDGVDLITDVPTSSVALAIEEVSREKKKIVLYSGSASSDITGSKCSPYAAHWTYDTYALAHGTGSAVVKNGGDTWFFLTADYAFGHALENDTAAVVKASGGKVLGRSSASPMPAATPSTRSSRRPSSASSRAGRSSLASWSSSPTCTRSASRRRRGCSSPRRSTGIRTIRRAPSPSASSRSRSACRPWRRPASTAPSTTMCRRCRRSTARTRTRSWRRCAPRRSTTS